MSLTYLLALILLVSTLLSLSAAEDGVYLHPGSNTDSSPGPAGVPPYEMVGRKEEWTPLVDFQDVTGWVVEGHEAEGWLVRSEEQKLYDRPHVGKLTYLSKGNNPTLIVRPEKPIPIPEPWSCVNFWNWGNTWCWVWDPGTPPLNVSVIVRDAKGRDFELGLGSMNYTYWFLSNGRLSAEVGKAISRPVSFVGFRFTNARNTEKRTIYLGPCTFYKEELKPLTFESWPKKLPFPTSKETILPTQKLKKFDNTVSQSGPVTTFHYRGSDADIAFKVRPERGGLGDIVVDYHGKSLRPCSQGGVTLATPEGLLPPDSERMTRTLKSQKLDGKTLTVVWEVKGGGVSSDVTYRYHLKQKSLIVDVEANDPVVERLAFGRAEPVTDAQVFRLPYLTYGGRDPHVLYANGLFLFLQCDWFVSDASVLEGEGRGGPGWAAFNGCALYVPKTDGSRNPLRERVFLNVSPDFQEVLPTIPNPPSPFREVQGERLWRVCSGADHAAEVANAKRYRDRGCEKVTVRYHEDSWRDTGESFTFRTAAAPGRGGDAALKKFVSEVQSLGWRVGLYTNYTDYAPVNALWDEDWVTRNPDGSWMGAWCRCYAPKPMRSVEAEGKLAPQIHARYGENHSYCDVHTAVSPFSRVDYDARLPGAGTFRRTFESFGRLLYNEKFAHHGPVYSEGNNHWWYAGLTDGNYAQIISGSPPQEPLLVDFDLLKMHPLEMDAGMGSPGMFFRGAPMNLDQFLATTIAYGHIGFLGEWDLPGDLKAYYMMQQTSKRYAMIPVRRIEREHEGKWLDTSQALATGAFRKGRLRVEYENGTEVTVNGSPEEWVLQCGERQFELPQWGYVVRHDEDGLLTYSAKVSAAGPNADRGPQRRVDCSMGAEQFYANSPGGFTFLGRLGADGAAALKKDWGGWWVITATECADFAFSPELAQLPKGRDVEVHGLKEDGTPDNSSEVRWSRGLLHLVGTSKECLRVQVKPATRHAPPVLRCDTTLAVAGEAVEAVLPAGVKVELAKVRWEGGQQTWPAKAQITGQCLTCVVPQDVKPGSHLWLAMPTGGRDPSRPAGRKSALPAPGPLWLDFIAVDAGEISLKAPLETYLSDGESVPVTLQLHNNLNRAVELPVDFSAGAGARCEPATLSLKAGAGATASALSHVTPPWREGKLTVTALVKATSGERTASRTLEANWSFEPLLDLASPSLGYTYGYCARGKQEVVATSEAHTEDGSFTVSRMASGDDERVCLFSHPPYGRNRAGYAYAIYEVKLPQAPTARFDFFIGMRSAPGISPTDGVTFKVIVLSPQEANSASSTAALLFSEHYATRQWKPVSLDLARFAGQTIRLKLIADCGPNDDTSADHALWGEPKVVLNTRKLRVRSVD